MTKKQERMLQEYRARNALRDALRNAETDCEKYGADYSCGTCWICVARILLARVGGK